MDECWEFILKKDRSAATVLVYTHNVYDEEEWNKVLDSVFNAKNQEGDKLFRKEKESMLIPIKMTQTGRPNKTTPEYEEYIEPWIKRKMEEAYSSWNRYEKIHLHKENEKLIKQKELEAEIRAENKILNWIRSRIEELDKDKDIMSLKYLEIKKRVLTDLLDSLK